MDVFGRTPVSVQNKLIQDSRRFFENRFFEDRLNKHDVLITEQLEIITALTANTQALENKIRLLETAHSNLETLIGVNTGKLNDALFDLGLVTTQVKSLEKTVLILVEHVDIIEKPK